MRKPKESYIYEEPSSIDLQDWLAFISKMEEEVKKYPDREDAIETLNFANEFIKDLKPLKNINKNHSAY